MKLRLISDLHLECGTGFQLPVIDDEHEQVLVLCGDITTIQSHLSRSTNFITRVCSRFKQVLYICGNHEFYKSDINDVPKLKERYKDITNLHILDDEMIEIDDIVIIGSTLWSNFNDEDPLVMYDCGVQMNDYRCIRDNDTTLNVSTTLKKFHVSRDFIFENVIEAKMNNKTVVVLTHHSPSFKSVAECFKRSNINGAFASHLDDLIKAFKPDYWLFGHNHNSSDFMIDSCRCICNPHGYKRESRYESEPFNPTLIVEVLNEQQKSKDDQKDSN